VLLKLQFEPAPLVLGFVLGRLLEEKFRQSLLISGGNLQTFVDRPIAATLLVLTALVVLISAMPAISRKREEVFAD
jgi:putative tricarboxylic transport membrane protein